MIASTSYWRVTRIWIVRHRHLWYSLCKYPRYLAFSKQVRLGWGFFSAQKKPLFSLTSLISLKRQQLLKITIFSVINPRQLVTRDGCNQGSITTGQCGLLRPFPLRRTRASWAAWGKALPAGWRRSSFPSTLHWWDIWGDVSSTGLPSTGEIWAYWSKSSRGTGKWLWDWREAERAVAAQPEEKAQGRSYPHV